MYKLFIYSCLLLSAPYSEMHVCLSICIYIYYLHLLYNLSDIYSWCSKHVKYLYCILKAVFAFENKVLLLLFQTLIHDNLSPKLLSESIDYYKGIIVIELLVKVCGLFRRSRIRSLLTYFCNYGRFCLTILKMKIFSNFLIGE